MSKNEKKFPKRLDNDMLLCYTLSTARGCAQALDTLGIHSVRPAHEGVGNRYGFCAMSESTMARLVENRSREACK